MDVKDAVKVALTHVNTLFEGEGVTNLGLEEVEFDHSNEEWTVTVGFSRPWDYPRNVLAAMGANVPLRSYKAVRIVDKTGEVLSVRSRAAGP